MIDGSLPRTYPPASKTNPIHCLPATKTLACPIIRAAVLPEYTGASHCMGFVNIAEFTCTAAKKTHRIKGLAEIYTFPEDMPCNRRAIPILHAVALCREGTCVRQSD